MSYSQYCRYRGLLKRYEGLHDEKDGTMNKENNKYVKVQKSTNCYYPNSKNISNRLRTCSAATNVITTKDRIDSESVSLQNMDKNECDSTNIGVGNVVDATDKEVSGCVRILFCRETFEHEGLLHHDLNCDHLGMNKMRIFALLSLLLLERNNNFCERLNKFMVLFR